MEEKAVSFGSGCWWGRWKKEGRENEGEDESEFECDEIGSCGARSAGVWVLDAAAWLPALSRKSSICR